MGSKINLTEKLGCFTDLWSPKIVVDLNDSHVKLVKMQGEFVWHQHTNEDELFFVLWGELMIELRDEVHLMLIEPKGILHTGDLVTDRTVKQYARI